MKGVLLTFVRQGCVVTPRPGLHDLIVSVGREVGVPLGCPVALVAKERLDVVQRHAVDYEPARRGVAHDPGREPPDARGLYRRVPDPVPEVPVIYRAALRG